MVIASTRLAKNHDFRLNHLRLNRNLAESGPTIAPNAGCGLRRRLFWHSTKVSTTELDVIELGKPYELWWENPILSLVEALRQAVGDEDFRLLELQLSKLKYERVLKTVGS